MTIEAEMQAYKNMEFELSKHYMGRHVAVLDGRVVDSDADLTSLAKRVYGFYGHKEIFFNHVGAERPAIKIRSPRLMRGQQP